MSAKKIIYVTPGESEKGELTPMAEYQLTSVIKNVLEWEIGDAPLVYRTTHTSSLRSNSLFYLSNKFRKAINAAGEAHYNNLISHPEQITSVIDSTKWWEAIIILLTQNELKNVLESLRNDWYDEVDKEKVNRGYNVYTVSVDTDSKKSNFFEAPRGK